MYVQPESLPEKRHALFHCMAKKTGWNVIAMPSPGLGKL